MNSIENIKKNIRNEIEIFEKKFKTITNSKNPLLNLISYYVIRNKGKQIRPILVFLSAKLINKEVTEKTYRGAGLIELIHTASLIHDDVIDNSNERRSLFSLNAIWRNKIAVLVGDYFLAKTLIISVENDDFDLLKITSIATKEMTEGEIFQLEKSRKLNINEDDYLKIIYQKTASLIIACCKIGAVSVTEDQEIINKIELFGEYLGMAFQMKDDLFDYTNDSIGKPTGIDIRERKMTLPLIYTLNNISEDQKKWIIKSIKKHNEDRDVRGQIIDLVFKTGGVLYTQNKMEEYVNKAMEVLSSFEENEYKKSLKELIRYVIERRN